MTNFPALLGHVRPWIIERLCETAPFAIKVACVSLCSRRRIFFKAARGRAGSLPHSRLARGPRGAGEGERRHLQRRLHFSFFYVLWRFVEGYWPRTPPTEGVAYLGQFIACKGIAVTRALRKQKERAVYVSDDGECRLSSVTEKDNLKNMATLTTTTRHK